MTMLVDNHLLPMSHAAEYKVQSSSVRKGQQKSMEACMQRRPLTFLPIVLGLSRFLY